MKRMDQVHFDKNASIRTELLWLELIVLLLPKTAAVQAGAM